MAATRAFNSTFFSSDEANAAVFESLPARLLRYDVGWAFYEGRQYGSGFSQGFMVKEGLYKYIADTYNPTARIGDFYKGSIWRGSLDIEAGEKGAMPIRVGAGTDEAKLRAAIAHTWNVSAWDSNKSVHVLHGTTMGDAAIYIRDDMEHEEVRKEILHPSLLKYVEMDARGFVKAYVIEEPRRDANGQVSIYRETCEHGLKDTIVFKTFKNNVPFAWDGNNDKNGDPRSEWEEPYGFVPLVITQHVNDGRLWGRSEIQPYIKKIAVIDDQASILNDSIRRIIDPDYLANVKKGDADITFTSGTPTIDNPKPGREQRRIFWINKDNARIDPIVTPIDIAGASANIKLMLENLEKDLPELLVLKVSNVSQDTFFGMRDTIEGKVWERRANYDKSEVRSNQMAIAIGGWRGYQGYEGFDLGSYDAGRMNFTIAPRPVFPVSDEAVQARKITRWITAADVSQKSGGEIPVESVLMDLGMTEEEMKNMPTQRMNAIKAQQEDTIPPEGL